MIWVSMHETNVFLDIVSSDALRKSICDWNQFSNLNYMLPELWTGILKRVMVLPPKVGHKNISLRVGMNRWTFPSKKVSLSSKTSQLAWYNLEGGDWHYE